MKFLFKLFFLLLIFCNPVWAEISVGYLIKTKGVSIGKMYWTVDTEDGFYNSSIKLDSTGFFSNLYKFPKFL